MRLALWSAFFLVCNVIGVEVFKAAITLPLEEALVPGILTPPFVGLAALSATRVFDAWQRRDE